MSITKLLNILELGKMQKVKSNELIPYIEGILKRKPKAKEMQEALKMSSTQIYYNRLQRNGSFSSNEISMIEEYFNIDLSNLPSNLHPNAVEIKRLEIEGLERVINPLSLDGIWLDKNLVRNIWCRNEADLRIISMPGSSMAGGITPIRANDTLVVDISVNELNFSGIFAYTTKKDSSFFVNSIELKADGSYKFSYFNPTFKDEIYHKEDLNEMNFRLAGQVIKNLSLEL